MRRCASGSFAFFSQTASQSLSLSDSSSQELAERKIGQEIPPASLKLRQLEPNGRKIMNQEKCTETIFILLGWFLPSLAQVQFIDDTIYSGTDRVYLHNDSNEPVGIDDIGVIGDSTVNTGKLTSFWLTIGTQNCLFDAMRDSLSVHVDTPIIVPSKDSIIFSDFHFDPCPYCKRSAAQIKGDLIYKIVPYSDGIALDTLYVLADKTETVDSKRALLRRKNVRCIPAAPVAVNAAGQTLILKKREMPLSCFHLLWP
jgi:hypothetical protein